MDWPVENDIYTPEQWAAILAETGPIDDGIRMQIAVIAITGRTAQMEKAKSNRELSSDLRRLAETLNQLEGLLADDGIRGVLSAVLSRDNDGPDEVHDEVDHFRAQARLIEGAAQRLASRLPKDVKRSPREKELLNRNYALTQWTAIYERLHPECHPSWNDRSGKASGPLCRYLVACCAPIFDELLGNVFTEDAARAFFLQRYDRGKAIFPF
jgi:hypothetical protein